MKIAIIGAGNMGGAIARGLAQSNRIEAKDITVSNRSCEKLNALKTEYPEINVTNSNSQAASDAQIVIVAVKPWLMKEVVTALNIQPHQILISIAAGIDFETLSEYVPDGTPLFRVIPNTAISQLASMNLIATHNANKQQTQTIKELFDEMGLSIIIEEKQFAACTSLTSCGIAYVLKYVQAAMQAGTELGVRPKDSMIMLAQTLQGAAQLLLNNPDTHPAIEIDKVTTPGGLTIKGVNQLEQEGFSKAVINAVKASV